MFNLLHKDGDTNIQLVETQPGVYEVTLHEGSHVVEYIRTIHLPTALDRYEQAIRDENDQYRECTCDDSGVVNCDLHRNK